MQNITEETLTIKDDLLLSNKHEIVQAVINGQNTYRELIVEGTDNAFEEKFFRCKEFQIFWTKLGESVIKLEINEQLPVDLETFFNRLQILSIRKEGILEHVSTSSPNIQQLFDKLPKLEFIRVKYLANGRWQKEFTRQKYDQMKIMRMQKDPIDDVVIESNQSRINDFPTELLENIFAYLESIDQLSVRAVCQRWFEICSTSARLDRLLMFGSECLSWETNPVKLFVHTNFKYNEICMDDQTNFNQSEDLTKFWEVIGAEIQEITLWSRNSNFMDAFKTGLKTNHLSKVKTIWFEFVSVFYDLLLKDVEEWKTLLGSIETLNFETFDLNEKNLHVEFMMPHVTQVQIWCFEMEDSIIFFNKITFPKIETFMIFHILDHEYESIFQTKLRFNQLKTLMIGKYEGWKENDFDLIVKSCSNLNILGVVISTDRKFDYDEKEWIYTEQRDLIQNVNCDKIAKMMFDKLETLTGIYFIRLEGLSRKSFKSYLRKSISRYEECKESVFPTLKLL